MLCDVGNQIKFIRKERGLTMQEFGNFFTPKASDSIVSRWEKGISLPNNNRLKKIAELGNTTVEELLGDSFSECPQCQNKKIKPDYNFCPICRFELKGGNINDK